MKKFMIRTDCPPLPQYQQKQEIEKMQIRKENFQSFL